LIPTFTTRVGLIKQAIEDFQKSTTWLKKTFLKWKKVAPIPTFIILVGNYIGRHIVQTFFKKTL
jgi:hypothetical protein